MIPLLVKHLAYDEDKLKVLSEVSWVLAYLSARYVYCPTPHSGHNYNFFCTVMHKIVNETITYYNIFALQSARN